MTSWPLPALWSALPVSWDPYARSSLQQPWSSEYLYPKGCKRPGLMLWVGSPLLGFLRQVG